ncbi:Cytoplasmic dynein 2 heavy chain 1 [Taenia solium]|eukprot:TsM_000710400 transcript=TsM_000710400 gene=TsM_000710400
MLMEVDLLREPGKWRAGLAWMRCRLAEVATAGDYPADHMRPWLAHLDRQLYKALGVQYRLGLEVLNQRMPEMRVELVYQHSQLAFQPPLEEALWDHANCALQRKVLLNPLFQALKRRGRTAEELPNEVKIDCLTRAGGCVSSDALEKLSVRPQTMEEMAGARNRHDALAREQSRLADRLACVEEKDKLLRHVSGCSVGAFSNTKSKWTKFQLMMDSFKLMMDEQLNVMQSNLDSRIKAFVGQLERFSTRWRHAQPSTDLLDSGDRKQCLAAVETIKSWKEEFGEMEKILNEILRDCAYFKMPLPNLDLVEELRSSLVEMETTWSLYEKFSLELRDLEKEDGTQLCVFDEFLTKWTDQLKTSAATLVTVCLMKEIHGYKELLPLLKWVRGDSLSPDHRMELSRLIGLPRGRRLEEVTFGTILSVAPRIVANASALKALTQRAQSEGVMREALQELDVWAAGATFLLTPYTDCRGKHLKLIKDWQDIVTQVGDNQALLTSLQGSPCFDSFVDRVNVWERKLADLDASLCSLQIVQRRWVYLEPIFGTGALKGETSRFSRVDVDFRNLMADIEADNRVVSLIKGRRENELQGVLTNMQDQLIRCQRTLNEYLEDKRNLFPRFYFLSDDDLLEMLGQSSNPTIIQTHLRKLFQAIYDVKFLKVDNGISITDFCSREGESVPIKKTVLVENEVENWLRQLETEMRSTLAIMFSDCVADRGELGDYPGQILALRESVRFSEKVEKAIKTGKLPLLLRELRTTLESYTEANTRCQRAKMDSDSDNAPQMLSRVSAAKLSTLILDTGHNIDVVGHLIREVTTSVHDWAWQKQLRFYSAGDVEATAPQIRMANAEFTYTFEYQGNSPRLVHTPLTDKCYLTLTQALQMGLGGNPYGPAGTGKTESVKQLGELFGRQVLVFNCDEGIDVESMGRIFVGLVKCGAWGCFDEFNRLEEAVMSAVSMQIQVIQNALRSGAPTVELLGKSINPNPTTSIFITMNPAGKGYGGRQKLPGNLKQLFRPVSMTRPDNELIAETLLFSYGFSHGHELGKKLVAIFTLSRHVSIQQHYDWGLRALKSVLRHAGTLLHQTRQYTAQENSPSAENLPESISQPLDTLVVETQLIIQSVRSCSLARLTYPDATRFEALLRDVFPDSKLHAGTQEDDFIKKLTKVIHGILTENHLDVIERQVAKTLEVYSLLTQRTGVVIVGPPGCGKSTILYVLWLALQKVGARVKRYIMNPKALSRTHLLGHIDPDTREWTDGVLTRSARDVVRETSGTMSWIICDGDVDPEWVESLNSVLDDNGLLTLPSGERIRFGGNVTFIFETHDLSCASPATVSRTGIVFISDAMLGSDALTKTWLLNQPKEHRQFLSDMLNMAFYQCLDWVETKNEYLIETSHTGTILNGLSHLVGATNRAKFTVGLIRGLGSNLLEAAKRQLATMVYEAMGEAPPDPSQPLNVRVDEETGTRLVTYSDEVYLVNPDSISSLGTDASDVESKGFVEAKSVQDFALSLRSPLVISAHIRSAVDGFRLWLDEPSAQQSFLLVGPEGCGKSLLLEYCLAVSKRKAHVVVMQCTAQTRSSHILDRLSQSCVTMTGSSAAGASRVLRPKEGDRLVLFLRDLNLPKPDKWGSCEVVAFLQQILTYQGYYDAKTLEFIGIKGIQIIATLTPSSISGGLGRFLLSPRLTSILRVASITNPNREELVKIYNCLLQHAVNNSIKPTFELATSKPRSMECSNRLHTLVNAMVHVWSQLEQTFRASGFPHCSFSLRDLTHWVIGMTRYNLAPEPISGNMWVSFGYEARRLFRDRMPGEEYRLRFDKLFHGLLNGDSETDTEFGGWCNGQSKTLSESALAAKFATGDPLMVNFDVEVTEASIKKEQHWFVSWDLSEPHLVTNNTKPYNKMLSLLSYSSLHKLVSSSLIQLARESYAKARELVVFPDFLDLVARIDRVLSRPHGNLLLAGRCGIGRRSALRVVVHLHQFHVFTLRVGPNFTKRNFPNDLKSACQSAGVDGVPTILLLEDHHLVHEIILDSVNSILSCGEAPGLISVEDIDSMTSSEGISLREAAAEASHTGTLMSFFAKRIQANLHVVILLDIDDSESLIARLQANPSLYKNCEVSWFDKWSFEGQSLLPCLLAPTLVEDFRKDSFSQACLAIHNSVPYPRLASPRRFISMCTTCQNLHKHSKNQLEFQITRFKAGLTKLAEARQHVNKLKMDAARQERQLREKQAEADKALSEISSAMQGAGKQRADMQELQRRSVVEATSLEARKATIDAEMARIGPLLQEARAAVGNIRSEALSEVRALRAPPDVIRDILEGVLLLMGVRDTSWASMRTFLARRGVQDEIRNFDARRITPELRRSVEILLKRSADSFSPKSARRASVAAAPLASWVHANVQYARVLEKLAPLEREQTSLQHSLETTQAEVQRLTEDLNSVDAKVADLRRVFELHSKAATDLQTELSKAKRTLSIAEDLVSELESEHGRWRKEVDFMKV